jgi:RimJ/RimL family protein N-acetyltransferase
MIPNTGAQVTAFRRIKDAGRMNRGFGVIKGEKVILRGIEPSDVRRLWEWTQDEETMRLRDYPPPPISLAQAERDFQEAAGDPSDLRLAVATPDGTLIGEVSLTHIDQRNGSARFRIAIGNPEHRGHGYGSDATRTLMRYAFDQLRLHRITLYVHEFNERAIGVYERCGFKREGRLRQAHFMDGAYTDVIVMGLLREDFEAGGG